MEVKPGFLALCPFALSSPLQGLGCIPKGLQAVQRQGQVPSLPSRGLWVSVPGAGPWQGQQSPEAGRCPSSSERTAGEHR